MTYFCLFSFLCGLWIFCSMREHLLSSLLSLEFMVIFIFSLMALSLVEYNFFYCIMYLIMTACEGALGLSILVVLSRTHGGDYFSGLGFLFNYDNM